MYISKEYWIPTDGIILEPNATSVVKSEQNTVITAGPGAGKTELLAQRACYLLQTGISPNPQKILALSFKVDAAENLKKRVQQRREPALGLRFESWTYDSFAKHLLDRFRLAIPEEYRPDQEYNIISTPRELKEIAIQFLNERHPSRPDWIQTVNFDQVFKMLSNDMLPLGYPGENVYDWVIHRLWGLLVTGKDTLKSSLTFPMISRLTEFLIRFNQQIKRALQMTYSHVFLDEFQDTTYPQYDLVKATFRNSDTVLTAVGDEKQSIMGWAGAMNDPFKQFVQDFNASAQYLVLNHRSAPRLIEVQDILARKIADDVSKVQVSEKWLGTEGLCEIWTFQDYIREAEHLAKYIKGLVNEQGISPREICVLVKQQEQIYGKALLDKLEINARIEKDYQDLLRENVVELLIDFWTLSTATPSPATWNRTTDTLFRLNGLDKNADTDECLTLESHLSAFLEEHRKFITAVNFNSLEEIEQMILEGFNKVLSYINKERYCAFHDKYSRGDFFNQLIKKTANKFAISYFQLRDWVSSIDDFLGKSSIPILTIHKSKGLEYDTVIFLGLEDDAFWSFKTQSSSDMKAFFVALSRAKRQVIFTFSGKREILKYRSLQEVTQNKAVISSLYTILESANVPVRDYY